MSPKLDLQEAKRIFDQAVELSVDERDGFLESACGSNADLRSRVESMLGEFEKLSGTVEDPWINSPSFSSVEPKDTEFLGTERFAVQRQLGSGAFGTVYEVWDREQQVTVAVKVLRSRKPDLLFRFKREFRALVDVRHPNLVRLYELFSESEHWFFSMELVEGETFLQYVRPGGGPCQFDRLRSSLRQLVEGVHALHAAKKLHRDLKPGNALITASGRVVVLDFGLVRELDLLVAERSQSIVAGTPAYMAPEQARQAQLSEASDWYAVGVMLFEALTGRLPHTKSILELMAQNSSETLPEPRQIDPDIPEDLNDLCRRMLQRQPEDRPDAMTILAALPPPAAPTQREEATEDRVEPEHFVGRSEQLVQLEAAFAETQEGHFNVLLMHGRSGIGKTALVNRFLALLAERHTNLIVLKGRCYEFESVPYKGLDALVDELSRYMQRLPEGRAAALLPRDAFLLQKLFPVLGRVKAIAEAPTRSAVVPDAQELRQRTFAALRELLARLSDRQPLVIWIDDLQWGDRDSSTFLADLCAPPQQPSLLLVLTYRSEELASNATLQYLHQVLANQRVVGNWRQMVLDELSNEDTQQLLHDLLPKEKTVAASAQARIIEEVGGHPLFLQQLVRFASSRTGGAPLNPTGEEWNLRTVLRRRVEQLPPFVREILEFICIAAQPLTISVLFTAAGSGKMDERPETLALLIREKFVRSSGTSAGRRVEPFHDQIRNVVVESLPPEIRRARHARLAAILALQPDVEPQVLVTHYQEAGDLPAAYQAALSAAQFAEGQLAFDRAAVFYQAALDAAELDPPQRAALYRKLGEALGMAGRGSESAHAYLRAAEFSRTGTPLDLQLLAVDQLMRSGYLDEALELFERLLHKVRIRMVQKPGQALRRILLARFRTRVLLLMGLPTPRNRSAASAEQMARLELLRTGGVLLTSVDPTLAAYFQTQHIVEALRVRDPVHLAIALAVESGVRVRVDRRGNVEGAFKLLDYAEAIATSVDNPNALGLIYLARGYVDYLLCRVDDGIRDCRHAIQFLRERCKGVAWEITSAYVLLLWFLSWAGSIKEVREHLPQLLKEGAARGDVNMEVSLRLLSHAHYWYLSLDQPHECIQDFQTALGRWSHRGYHLQHYGAMFALVESCWYLGDYTQARQHLITDWETMSRSFILRWQTLLIRALFLRGRAALACWLQDTNDNILRAEVEEYAKRLKRIRSPWSWPMYLVLRSGLAVGNGRRREAAEYLDSAAQAFEKESLHTYASAARYFCGLLRNDERGREQIESANDFLRSQQVVNHAAFLRMLLPGQWVANIRQ